MSDQGRRPILPAVMFAALAILASSGARATELDPKRFEALRDRWVAAAESLGVPGLAIAVVSADGGVWFDTIGVRDMQRRLPVTPRTRFYIASCTKPFLALTVHLLVERGALDLDAPVRHYLPRFELADSQLTRTLTLRDLLAHRQGLESWPITFGEAFTGEMPDTRFYRLLRRVKPEHDFEYTNLHYTLAGRVIETVTGSSWKEAMQREVLTPAGMTRSTTSATNSYADRDVARPYRIRDGHTEAAHMTKTDRTTHAAGGLFSTTEDLARWLRVQLATGEIDGRRVWSEDVLRDLRQPQISVEEAHPLVPDQKRTAWGLGWEVRELAGHRMIVHGGHFEGAGAHMSFLP